MEQYEAREYHADSRKNGTLEKFTHPVGLLIGGCIIMLFGVYLYFLGFTPFVKGLHPEFLAIVSYAGLFTVAQGALVFTRGTIGNKWITLHQTIMVLEILLSLGGIVLLVALYNHPIIVPIFSYGIETIDAFIISFPVEASIVQLGVVVIIALTVLGAVSDMYQVGKLEKYK